VRGEIAVMRVERSFLFAAVIVGCILLLPIVGFVLTTLWPQRELVSWLLFGLIILVVLVRLALWVIKASTIAKIRLSEEALRPGRLYAHERLVEEENKYNEERIAQQRGAVMDEPYIQQPYRYPHDQTLNPYETNNVSYTGLKPLSMESYDWDEEK
jgi:hypothetical protein